MWVRQISLMLRYVGARNLSFLKSACDYLRIMGGYFFNLSFYIERESSPPTLYGVTPQGYDSPPCGVTPYKAEGDQYRMRD